MSAHNGSPKSPAKAVARRMVELTHDAITLAELQAQLLKVEVRGWARGLVTPLVLLLVATCFVLGCIPVLLFSFAYFLAATAQLSLALSLLIAALAGLAVAIITALVGRRLLLKNRGLLEQSHAEFARNIAWFKKVLQQNADAPACNTRRENDAARYKHSN